MATPFVVGGVLCGTRVEHGHLYQQVEYVVLFTSEEHCAAIAVAKKHAVPELTQLVFSTCTRENTLGKNVHSPLRIP